MMFKKSFCKENINKIVKPLLAVLGVNGLNEDLKMMLTLMLLVANLANTKLCKKPEND